MSNVREQIEELEPDALLADGFDEALLGIAERSGGMSVAAYDREKCVAILLGKGMSYEDAQEHLDFNVVGAWVGEHTPVFVSVLTQPEPDLVEAEAPTVSGELTESLAVQQDMGRELLINYAGNSFIRMSKPVYKVDVEAGGMEAVKQEAAAELGGAVLDVLSPSLAVVDEAELRMELDFMVMKPAQAAQFAARCYAAGGGQP